MENTPARRTGGGTTLIKSVSLFVASGRKVTAAAAAIALPWQSRAGKRDNEDNAKKTQLRRMADEAKWTSRNLETLKKNTHFTR
jgi:hypothetical protein